MSSKGAADRGPKVNSPMVIGRLFGKDKGESGGSDLAMAYLEDAQAKRTPLLLVDPKGRELPAQIQSLMEDRLGLTASGLMPVEKGDKFSLLMVHDGLRLRLKLRAHEVKNGVLMVAPPSDIELAERRKKPRARLNLKEGATGTLLTSLFEGTGVTGALEGISEGGFRLKVEKAMEIKGERKLHIAQNLLPPGSLLMLIKLSKLPKAPNLEVDGKVVYAQMDGATLYLGVAFSNDQGALKGLVSSRTSAVPSAVPPKARRSQERSREEERDEDLRPGSAQERPSTERAAPAPAPEPQAAPTPSAPPPAPAPEAPPSPDPKPDRGSALNNLKRRSRGILLAMEDSPERDWLLGFLQDQGFQRVFPTATLTQVMETMNQPGISLVIIDGGVAELKGLELADFLQTTLGEGKPPILVAQEKMSPVIVMAARRSGVDQLLVKPYELDGALAGMVDTLIGL